MKVYLLNVKRPTWRYILIYCIGYFNEEFIVTRKCKLLFISPTIILQFIQSEAWTQLLVEKQSHKTAKLRKLLQNHGQHFTRALPKWMETPQKTVFPFHFLRSFSKASWIKLVFRGMWHCFFSVQWTHLSNWWNSYIKLWSSKG